MKPTHGLSFISVQKIRLRTGDLKRFHRVEQKARDLGMRFLTTFNCRSPVNRRRTLDIRYYDEFKKDGSRVIVSHSLWSGNILSNSRGYGERGNIPIHSTGK